ncbi:MAG: NADH:ubiquinone reductase (Na(+)-transporting) subunit F [Nitrospiraceae bacterium]|nr:MAG: NADH:ubiquinone reductase (Na(+)-transporting) subunit F [Nitrospiraceae bacterium]
MTGISLVTLAVVTFTLLILVLVFIILAAKSKLVASGPATLQINDDPERSLTVPAGGKLLNTLADNKIYLASACGGGGTCGECRVVIREGAGDVLPTEKSKLTRRQIHDQFRLSCQVPVKNSMKLEIPPEALETKQWVCTIRSNRNVASFIKELVLELPPGEEVAFRAGGYIQAEAPPHSLSYLDFIIEDEYKPDWDRFDLWKFESVVDEPVIRAYSMANYPEEKGVIVLNVRIATPPLDEPDIPPGKMSSYLFSMKPGDQITISGPYGEFFAQDSSNEMIIIGGGAGMAPLRSIIFDQLERVKTSRKISFYYGARSMREAFYVDHFTKLAEKHDNFAFHLALSRPHMMQNWTGYKGYVQHCLHDTYLKDHPAPEDCEYYICGPPALNASVIMYLDSMGVEPENIFYDDFGGS